MKSLYLRIYLTIVAVLLLFALTTVWIAQHHLDQERQNIEAVYNERTSAWAQLIENSLPPATAPPEDQRKALMEWAHRLRLPLALDDAQGTRIATSEGFARHQNDPFFARRLLRVPLADGRALTMVRLTLVRPDSGFRPPPRPDGSPSGGAWPPPAAAHPPGLLPERIGIALHYAIGPLFDGIGLVAALVVLFFAVAIGAFPVVRRLTRRLEALKRGVEAFGAGSLGARVPVEGRDEVAALAASFNGAAGRIEQLVHSHQSLLANASHELRSPLARLKMALSMLDTTDPARRANLLDEAHTNIAELDALVEEVLLASRLDAHTRMGPRESVDLVGLGAEEASRVGAELEAPAELPPLLGEERLLRRALRNLLENARRYGGGEVLLQLAAESGRIVARVCDRGPGVPADMRERIFEPFFRLPGHAEQTGGVGLGLSLVKQIAERHGGSVVCQSREGGGSCFVLCLPPVPAD